MGLNSVLLLLGRGSPWIIGWYFTVNFLRASISSFSFNSFLWANAKPRAIRCKIPPGNFLNTSVPFVTVDGTSQPSRCLQYLNYSSTFNVTVPCENGYKYDSYVDTSITTEWNLVCDKEYLSAFADSAFFSLSLIGSVASNALADRYGRKFIFIGCMLAQALLGFLTSLSPNVIIYIVLRMLLGPLQQATYTIGYCYVLELFPIEWRSAAGLLNETFWTMSGVLLCGIVYFVRDWRYYHYVTTLPFMLSIILFWVMPESVPWLIAKGRIDDAKSTLSSAARFSKKRHLILEMLSSTSFDLRHEEKENQTLTDMNDNGNPESMETNSDDEVAIYPCYYTCTHRYLRRSTFINIFVWFTVGTAYYGLQVQAMRVGNPYINFLLLTVIDLPAIFLAVPFSRWLGRKVILMFGYLVLGPSIALVYITMRFLPTLTVVHVIFSLIGKFMVTLIYTVLFLHTSEIYPTTLRSVGMAIGTSLARMGVTITPFLVLMENLWSWFPSALLAVAAVISGILVKFLPETRNKPLPRTLEDIYNWWHSPERKKTDLKDSGNC